jgi:hypothetical protein
VGSEIELVGIQAGNSGVEIQAPIFRPGNSGMDFNRRADFDHVPDLIDLFICHGNTALGPVD